MGMTMRNVTWKWFPIKKFAYWSKLFTCAETSYFNRDTWKFKSSQKEESKDLKTDSSKACSKLKFCIREEGIEAAWTDTEFQKPRLTVVQAFRVVVGDMLLARPGHGVVVLSDTHRFSCYVTISGS